MLAYEVAVQARTIAFVLVKRILGIPLMVLPHEPVAGDLGQYRRRGNGQTERIHLNDGPLHKCRFDPLIAVNK